MRWPGANVQARSALTILLLIIAYAALPWMTHSSVALTVNAYDLAEWVSIDPAVRADSLLLTPLLLRLPLVCIAWYIALSGRSWLRIGAIGLLAAALLPPLEFLGSASNDPNYRQQFALALLTLMTGLVLFTSTPPRHRAALSAVILSIGLASGVLGLARALPLLSSFDMHVMPGAGAIAFSLISLAVILIGLHRHAPAAQSTAVFLRETLS